MVTRQSQNADPGKIRLTATASGGNYPISVIDNERLGWWVATNGSVQYTLFVSRSGEITQYPALGGNLQNGVLVLCPKLGLLVAIDGGYEVGQYASNSYHKLYVRNLSSGAMTTASTAGVVPSLTDGYDGSHNTFHRPDAMGLQWVDELGCIVGLDQTVEPPNIVKLSPPASDPANGVWTWTVEAPLQHWAQDVGGQAQLQTVLNGVWSKFRWVPSLHAFVYGTDKGRKPQVLRVP